MFYRDDVHAVALCRGCDAVLTFSSGAWYDRRASTVCVPVAGDHETVYHDPMPAPLKGAPTGGNHA